MEDLIIVTIGVTYQGTQMYILKDAALIGILAGLYLRQVSLYQMSCLQKQAQETKEVELGKKKKRKMKMKAKMRVKSKDETLLSVLKVMPHKFCVSIMKLRGVKFCVAVFCSQFLIFR